jgi:hypothetical protein
LQDVVLDAAKNVVFCFGSDLSSIFIGCIPILPKTCNISGGSGSSRSSGGGSSSSSSSSSSTDGGSLHDMALQLLSILPNEDIAFVLENGDHQQRRSHDILQLWLVMHDKAVQDIRRIAAGHVQQGREGEEVGGSSNGGNDGNSDDDEGAGSGGGGCGRVSISILSPLHGSTIQGHAITLSVRTAIPVSSSFAHNTVTIDVVINGRRAAADIQQLEFATPIDGTMAAGYRLCCVSRDIQACPMGNTSLKSLLLMLLLLLRRRHRLHCCRCCFRYRS